MTVPEKILAVFRRHYEETCHEFPGKIAKAKAFGANPDWPWNGFVLSFSTRDGSENWKNNVKKRAREFSWDRVISLSDPYRLALFRTVPNLRFRAKVCLAIESAYQRILKAGGPAAVRNSYRNLSTPKARIAFFKSFDQIGDKYARNIPMDAYDPLVRNHFALDHHPKKILSQITGQSLGYRKGEQFLLELAGMLGIDAWTFDRLLYSRYKIILGDLAAASSDG